MLKPKSNSNYAFDILREELQERIAQREAVEAEIVNLEKRLAGLQEMIASLKEALGE
jgi:predicted  nucleic acid-binding Zn-ribbon protein